MSDRFRASLTTLALACAFASFAGAACAPVGAGRVGALTETPTLAGDGMLEWFNRPALVATAEHGSWLASLGGRKVQVRGIDPLTGVPDPPVDLHTYEDQDDHGAPALLLISAGIHEGRLLCFYALHGSQLVVRRSVRPYDASEWESPVVIETNGATYPQPHVTPSGEVILLYRWYEGSGSSVEVYRTSSDGGSSWSDKTVLLRVAPPAIGAVYAVSDMRDGVLDVAWSVFETAGPTWSDVYHIAGSPGGPWVRGDGTVVTPPITGASADEVTRTAPGDRVYVLDIRSAGPGDPRILFANRLSDPDSTVNYSQRRAEGWDTTAVCESPSMTSGWSEWLKVEGRFPCGAAIDPNDTDTLLVTEGRNGTMEAANADCTSRVSLWHRSAADWARVRRLTEPGGEDYFEMRPQFASGTGSPRAVWVRAVAPVSEHRWQASLIGWTPARREP